MDKLTNGFVFEMFKGLVRTNWGINITLSAPVGLVLTYFWGASDYYKTFILIYTFIGLFLTFSKISVNMLDEIDAEESKREINMMLEK